MPQLLMPWGDQPHSEMECRELLFPALELFTIAHGNAFNKWEDIDGDTRSDISIMQRGGVLHDLITAQVSQLLNNEPMEGVEVCKLGFFKLYVGDKVVVRFKKLAENHVVELDGQRPNTKRYYNCHLMPEVRSYCTRTTCGYVLRPDGTLFDVVVACQTGDGLAWSYSVLEEQPAHTSDDNPELPPQAEVFIEDDSDPSDASGANGEGVA
jgi:hypothetical protein